MSVLSVAAEHTSSPTSTTPVHIMGVVQRARRAISMAGVTALLLGATLGLVQADPRVLASLLGYQPHSLVVMLAGAGLIGLVGGLIAGLALRGRTGMLRWMVGMAALLIGLMGSKMVYGIVMRMPLRIALTSTSDGIEAAQIGIGATMALLGSLVGRSSKNGGTGATTRVAAMSASPGTSTRGTVRPRSRRISTRARVTAQGTSGRSVPSPVESREAPIVVKPKPRPKRRWFKRRQVSLGQQTTSICPYCLEEVLPNDPRGRVVCDICGTPHHGDCWAITGKCEVPHLQT
ncbi:MAG: hypothetical protein JXB07_11735 [Anaerolineae bacterium]|nr:hypothetical protein [Anaerolineae bacterium]